LITVIGARAGRVDRHGAVVAGSIGMTTGHPSYEEWLASMARSTSAAVVAIHDGDFRLLLLHPTYQDAWQLPGGTVEHGQDPWQAAVREVGEETGQHLGGEPQLIGVDWCRPAGLDPYAQFFFAGPCIDAEDFTITLSSEHDAWDIRTVEEWKSLLEPTEVTRLTCLREALQTGRAFYLQDGRHPTT
jgi:8-oxo-dGTP pyrophosphatase MutT (NUDIX family)